MKHGLLVQSQALLVTIAQVGILYGDKTFLCFNLSVKNLTLPVLLGLMPLVKLHLLIDETLQVVLHLYRETSGYI